jgi:hypothetical protein
MRMDDTRGSKTNKKQYDEGEDDRRGGDRHKKKDRSQYEENDRDSNRSEILCLSFIFISNNFLFIILDEENYRWEGSKYPGTAKEYSREDPRSNNSSRKEESRSIHNAINDSSRERERERERDNGKDAAVAAPTRPVIVPPDLSNMRRFLTTPVPKSCGIVQCYIRRNKNGTNKLYPIYSLYLKVREFY